MVAIRGEVEATSFRSCTWVRAVPGSAETRQSSPEEEDLTEYSDKKVHMSQP